MAIITEEPEIQPEKPPKEQTLPKPKNPTSKPKADTNNNSQKQSTQSNPFVFWFYLTLSVSLITLFAISFSSLSSPSDPKSFFLSLSSPLRHHYSNGRSIKVQLAQNEPPVEVFTLESGNNKPSVSEKVVIVHGLGLSSFSFRKAIDFLGSKGVHGVVFDLPGSGFSDKTREVVEERGNGVFGRFSDVYDLIKEKGFFWAFDKMVETGQIPYEEIVSHFGKKKSVVKPIALGGEEMGRVLAQVIGTLGLAPVHLVLHDSSLGMVANWVLENPGLIRSLTLVDTGSRPALPLWLLKMPVVRDVLLMSNVAYGRLISLCCSREIGGSNLEAHRMVFRGRDGGKAVVGTMLNSSFDLAEWGGLDGIKGMPMQLIWSRQWSKEWSDEGRRISEALPQAKFVTHSGGRWPQEDVAAEVAEHIIEFVSSLPESVRQVEEETIPEHIQKMFDEATGDDHHHHHHSHGNHDHHGGHAHIHAAGYMDPYGMGHGWGG